jgi:hypothetical protein
MKSIHEIRKNNLEHLINQYGSIKNLSDTLGKAPALISQIRCGKGMGEKLAREIEQKLSLSKYFLDQDRTELDDHFEELVIKVREQLEQLRLNPGEKVLLDKYRKLTKEQKQVIIKLLDSYT